MSRSKKVKRMGYQGLSHIVSGLPLEGKLRARMILLGVDEPEDFHRVLLKDSEFCDLLAQSLRQTVEAFVRRRFRFALFKEDLEDFVQEVSIIVWDAISEFDPSRGVSLSQFCSSLFLRTFNARNRQQRIQSHEMVVSALWHTDDDEDSADPLEDFWESIADGRNLEEEVIKRDELEKIAFFEGYLNPEELAEAVENASKVKRHRWRRRLLSLRDQMLKRTKPERRKNDKNHCDRCKKGFRMQSAFKAFGARYLVAKCPAFHCRVVFPAEDRGSRYQMKKQQVVSTFVGGDKNA